MTSVPTSIHDWFACAEGRYDLSLSHSACQTLHVRDLLNDAELKSFSEISLAYGAFDGLSELRSLIADQYRTIDASQVQAFHGPSEAIYSLMRGILKPGDRVVVPRPTFEPLRSTAELIGCEISEWHATDSRSCTFDVDDLAEICDESTKLIVINIPHNPSGQIVSPSELDRIVQIAAASDAILLSDESFRLLELEPHSTLPAVCDLYDRGISLAGLSKPFGLGGLRIGWIASKSREICDAAKEYRYNTSELTNTPCQWLGCHALRKADQILTRNRATIARNLERLESFVTSYSETLRVFPPKAGTMAVVEQFSNLASPEFCERLLNEERLFLLPGNCLGMSDRLLRFGLGMPDFKHGLERLSNFLQHLPQASKNQIS